VKELKAVRKPTTKDEVERMYKIGYYLDRSFLKPTDVVDLGLDVYRLKEFGEVRMKKTWAKIRPMADQIWGRMTDPMKVMFWWSYYCQGLDYLNLILNELDPILRNLGTERRGVELLQSTMCQKLPPELQAKIKEGFGREWGSE
jgi:hypothetical protein